MVAAQKIPAYASQFHVRRANYLIKQLHLYIIRVAYPPERVERGVQEWRIRVVLIPTDGLRKSTQATMKVLSVYLQNDPGPIEEDTLVVFENLLAHPTHYVAADGVGVREDVYYRARRVQVAMI
jgi:predicted class III extradiol MEMO1 family dioxygenase